MESTTKAELQRLNRLRKKASNRFLRGWSPLQAKHLLSELKLRPP